ncbi:MAG: bifunctional phosphoribosylaminoimidazolecarboxamide formyltransferase/IMP cyclohydrolase [Deltaproteobacteria bacterium]|nr:bifunctional phosphoribosylaminoimidazolecarboxamide formyltransferase/IMP cyclohydrolase [Deltaproteobacteria bacterium]
MTATLRAILSVSDKTGIPELGRRLAKLGAEILSTGGTAKALREAGVPVVEVGDYTGAPEILDGRVKTLHPKVAGGMLGRPTDEHRKQMSEHGIPAIDLVVVNLYPFKQTVAKGAPFEEIIENIDIGGPTMIRAAAKNHERATVLVDPSDYGRVCDELEQHGKVPSDLRYQLARKAFAHTAAYDGAIAAYLGRVEGPHEAATEFPKTLHPELHLHSVLRYGENPHQSAAFYAWPDMVGPSLAKAAVLQGKELSYNNLLDLDGAYKLCLEFADPAAVIVKHTNPCGTAVSGQGVLTAYKRARETDPVSAFGGIVACNRAVDAELAKEMTDTFLECIIAPEYTADALARLGTKKNLRVLRLPFAPLPAGAWDLRTVAGGVLVQARDVNTSAASAGRVVTKRAPTAQELADLDFAWRVTKHVKSNAIVFAGEGRTVGVGAGQMSRVDSVKLAISKARLPLAATVIGSDAFFPFRDGVDEAAKVGITAIIQPGGSVRDQEVIDACDQHGITMVFSGERHFRH